MEDLNKIQKIIDAYPEKCPYCFKKLKYKLFKPSSTATPYCSACENYIDLEWDYLNAIADKVKKYMVIDSDDNVLDFKNKIKR